MSDSLRPASLADFAGQPQLSHDISVLVGAARTRGQNPDHVLLAGPPGLGKTTLAQIVALELGQPLVSTSAPALERPGDLIALLTALRGPTVVFVDEVHSLVRRTEELLYSAMEDGHVDVIIGEGTSARSLRVKLQPFTLVGATTQMGLLTAPLRDRFGFIGRLVPYADDDLARIVARSAKLLGVDVDTDAAMEIAKRSRGTPRVANRWLRRVRDWAQVEGHDVVTGPIAVNALNRYGIDELGLDQLGRDIVISAIANFAGGPVGLAALAASIGEVESTIEQVYEPSLMARGLWQRTPRGRVVTDAGYRHVGLTRSSAPAGKPATDPLPSLWAIDQFKSSELNESPNLTTGPA